MVGRFSSTALLPYVVRPAIAVALTALVYLSALSVPFVYDDQYLIVENPSIRNIADIRAIVLLNPTRPLLNLSYAIDYALWGLRPIGYHLTNLLLHLVNVALLFHLARRITEDWQPGEETTHGRVLNPAVVAFTAALLFGVHPLMTSAVTYVSGRSEVLGGTFYLSAILAGRHWLQRHGGVWWVLVTVFWLAALATKEIAVMLPVVLICYERLIIRPNESERRRSLIFLMLPLAIVSAGTRLATFTFTEHPGIALQWEAAPQQLLVLGRYLALMLRPEGQLIFHTAAPVTFADFSIYVAAVMLLIALSVAWIVRKALGIVTFGVFWFLLVLLPSSVLAMMGAEPMAEHRLYVASCGLFVAAGAAAAWALQLTSATSRGLPLALRALFGIMVISLCGRTVIRNIEWSNPVALWRAAVAAQPRHAFPYLLLAQALQVEGRLDEAIEQYRTGIDLDPTQSLAYQKLALCLVETGRFDEAIATLDELRARDPRSPVASNGLGAIAMMRGEPERARQLFLTTLTHDPNNIPARQSLVLLAEREPVNAAEALRLCEEIQRIAPRTPGNDECIDRNRERLRGAPAR
jgi:tetratricopeptide (TPR) repeat protein